MATGTTGSSRDYPGRAHPEKRVVEGSRDAYKGGECQNMDTMSERTSVTGGDMFNRTMGWYKKSPRPDSAVGGVIESARAWLRGRPIGQG